MFGLILSKIRPKKTSNNCREFPTVAVFSLLIIYIKSVNKAAIRGDRATIWGSRATIRGGQSNNWREFPTVAARSLLLQLNQFILLDIN